MFCIASFIVFAILGLFSASYRPLAKKAWYCVFRKITFRPCDINFDQEVKGKLLGSIMKRSPLLARFVYKWGNALAAIFVILSVWSLLSVLNAGLNLYVYDTCNPRDVQSCSLGGEACGIDQARMGFATALQQGTVHIWAAEPFIQFGKTITRIPDRMRSWNASEYLPADPSYRTPFDQNKPTALEVIDPGCRFCAQLLSNIQEAGFDQQYNLTYIAYPIPSTQYEDGYKFKQSYRIAAYLEALRIKKASHNNTPDDWTLLETILVGHDTDGIAWQEKFNTVFSNQEAEDTLLRFLRDMGYNETEQTEIQTLAQSDEVSQRLKRNAEIVENNIRTIKIPTIIFDGRRYDRVVDVKTLSK